MNRAFIIVSLLLALVVAALTVLVRGTSIPTAAAVARNTAIFSGFVFALAFAYPGSRGWAALPDQPNYPALLLAFVAAHLVHYGAVVARAIVEHGGRRLFSGAGLLTTAFGFSVVALIGLTAPRPPRTTGRRKGQHDYGLARLASVSGGLRLVLAAVVDFSRPVGNQRGCGRGENCRSCCQEEEASHPSGQCIVSEHVARTLLSAA